MIKGDYAAARDAFNAALAEIPELDAAYVGLAQTYVRQSNDAEAIGILEAARSKRPGRYLLEYYFGLWPADQAARKTRSSHLIVRPSWSPSPPIHPLSSASSMDRKRMAACAR